MAWIGQFPPRPPIKAAGNFQMCAALVNGLGGAAGFGTGQLTANDDGFTEATSLSSVFTG